jgi:hypothetical protein
MRLRRERPAALSCGWGKNRVGWERALGVTVEGSIIGVS